MSTYQDRLDRLERKKEQLLAQIRDAKAKATKEARKDDTRRKILAGAMLLAENGGSWDALRSRLADYLERPMDRQLFGLPVKPPADPEDWESDGESDDD